jgi:AraC-like DNA-binding protein
MLPDASKEGSMAPPRGMATVKNVVPGETMRDDRRDSGLLMLISPQRVFYAGLLGRPRGRTSGAFLIYACIEGSLKVTREGRCEVGLTMTMVPPYVPHTIESEHPVNLCLMIEPETVHPGALDALAGRIAGPDGPDIGRRIRAAYHQLRAERRRDGFTTQEFDDVFLGAALPPRRLDPRVASAVARLVEFPGNPLTAAECASGVGLSQSRFLHLFKDETSVSFRACRAWKRARHLLHFVNEDINFAHLAQDIGYPDSTHFSHSIRRFYGLKPRAIFTGSRDLAIYRSGAWPAAGSFAASA